MPKLIKVRVQKVAVLNWFWYFADRQIIGPNLNPHTRSDPRR
jgi:hypothetical protein